MKKILALFTCLFALSFTLPANAMTLNQAMSALSSAKASGEVGEKPDGYLGVVKSSPQAEEIAQLINQARKAEYSSVAKKNGISLRDVESMAGQKAIERTTPGNMIQRNGRWQAK